MTEVPRDSVFFLAKVSFFDDVPEAFVPRDGSTSVTLGVVPPEGEPMPEDLTVVFERATATLAVVGYPTAEHTDTLMARVPLKAVVVEGPSWEQVNEKAYRQWESKHTNDGTPK